ncbi:hypothetical protein ORFS20B [Halorubrum tailed virus]|nr:hypothetical protein ORF33 [Halorubrum tailed virus]WDY79117.1 hypothetical protein ORFS20A [Halorubrum tailed virus]WDY79165.1 hypothetical protein ORFS20B [Halorubrum tailed virus]WDY79214.1 hypothetical protein ORF_00029 [Halorubrum tailed virus]
MTALITRAIRRPMNESDDKGLSYRANTDGRSTDDEQRQYQFGGDLVITSSASAGAWMSATCPVDLTEAQ